MASQKPEAGRAGPHWHSEQCDNVSLRAIVLSWFLPGHLEAPKAELEVSCPASTLEPLLPSPWSFYQPATPGGLLWVPLTYSCAPDYLLTQLEPVRRGPAPPVRPPTAQEVCYRRAQQAQRESASWLQAAQRPAEKLSSVHISAPGEKKRIAHVPNPHALLKISRRTKQSHTQVSRRCRTQDPHDLINVGHPVI